MAQSYEFLPDGDIENDGWTIVGGSATKISEVWYYYYDDCYARCPAYRGGAEVKFPFDYSSQFPQGAIIDSITVRARMSTAAGSGARGVTVNVLSADNRSRYTTRTLYANSNIQEYEVGTYSKDPLGRAWDIHRLNKLRLRVFSSNNLADSVRIYGLWVVVNFHTKPQATVLSPSGTVNTPSPVVKWQYTQEDGEPQKFAEYKIFTLAQASATAFSAETSDPIYSTTTQGIANEYILPTSLNNDQYKIFVRVTSQHGAKSLWAEKQFTVSAPAPGIPGDNNAGVSGVPGVGTPTVIPDNYTSSAAIRMTDTSNLLSVQQADFEIASDPLGYVGDNAALARDTEHAFAGGIASMSITAESTGNALAVSTPIEIHPSQPVTVRSQILADDTARTVNLTARFYDEAWTELTGSEISTSVTDSDETWVEASATGTTPATAKYCEIVAEVEDAAEDEVHYIDHVGLMYGTDTAWSDGGHASRNLLTSFLASGDDPASVADSWTQANAATTVARVTASGTGAHGAKCFQMTYVGADPSIEYRATSSVWESSTSGSDFTLNKPAGLQDNDLMIAFVTSNEHGTITPPFGWSAVNTASVDDGSTDIALYVLKRTGLASDPSTWATGSLSATSTRRSAVVVAYSGAAHADEQFITDAVRTDATGSLVHQTATVVNTDPNAWRVSAFTASDNVSGGGWVANTDPPNVNNLTISYVGKATAWKSTTSNTSFTINKPSGVKAGDLMIAAAIFSGSPATVNAPTGWTQVRKTTATLGNGDDHSGTTTMVVFKRVAGSSEPNSWTATHSSGPRPKITQCVAYRGCDSNLIAETATTKGNGSSVGTGSVTNNNSKAWRINIFGACTNFQNYWDRADTVERTDDSTSLSGWPDTVVAFNDSNGMVGTGSHSRTANFGDGSFFSAVGWIGLLAPATSLSPAGPDEEQRSDDATGSSVVWTTTAVFDSDGAVGEEGVGSQTVYGSFTSSDGAAHASASWIGFLKPEASTQGGEAAAYPNEPVDLDLVPDEVFDLAKHRLTVMADFKGSTAGTPTLAVEFYRANQLLSVQSAAGRAFGTDGFTKSWAVFSIPTGTTRVRPRLAALEREVNDTVAFDRVSVMLGALADEAAEPQWRNGTSRPEHPVWSHPVIEYQENDGTGWSEWKLLAGQRTLPPQFDPNTSQMFYVDHTIVPNYSRRYRVATKSYGLDGDTFSSGFGPTSQEAIFEARTWWLKDIQDLSRNMQITVKWKDQQVDMTNMATAFQPIGESFPVVISEGFKGDTFGLEIHCESAEFTQLMSLLDSGRTLILQSDIDRMWWVRPVGNIQSNILATSSRQERPRRYVSVTFAQVAPED
jgi:hypothetical protein